MLEKIKQIDIELFLFLNSLHTPFFDTVMYLISSISIWIPLYLFVMYLVFRKFGKQGFIVLAFFALLVLVADQSSVQLFKNVFKRLRPCHNNEISHLVHLVNNHCGGMYSFVSSHATNSFAFATFTSFLFKERIFFISLYIWATVVSYSRIYLGVHFPIDVFSGAVLGVICGLFVYFLYRKIEPSRYFS